MSTPTVLIIEDDANMLQLLQLMLQRNGYEVSLANRPQEGLEKALVERPSVIIVDLMMPEMNGFEVIRRLRADPRGADVPILVLTARSQPLDRKAALAAGADAYLSKPASTRTLLDKLAELVARARPRQGRGAGQIVVVFSLRGGVGATTLAVNLALLLQRAPQGACLLDLDRSGGQVGLHLELQPAAHWGRLLAAERSLGGSPSTLTNEDVAALLMRHDSGLYVLAAPQEAVSGEGLRQATVQALLRSLRERFSFTIVDAAAVLDEATSAALGLADVALLVFAPEASSVHTAGVALRAVTGTAVEPRLSLVMNHPTALRPLPQANVEHNLGRSVALSVPFDETQVMALARGVPLALQPATPAAIMPPLVKAVRDLAVHVAGFRLQTVASSQ
jgi:CheY-like chemotaxis protein/MinD-like ATPase involved in chromosome partitioning or flagellar assembly